MLTKAIDLNTFCVGRNVIGMPKGFLPSEVTTGQFKEAGLGKEDAAFDLMVRAARLTPKQFSTEVSKRRKEIVDSSEERVDILRLEQKLSDLTTLFRVQRIDDAYVSEMLLLRDGNLVRITLKSYDNEFLKAEERLQRLASRIKTNESANQVSGPEGFCLGPVLILGVFQDEDARFRYRDGSGADFAINVSSYTGEPEVPLLSRVTGPDSLLAKFDVHHRVIRARERTVAGTRAQEWLGQAQIGEHPGDMAFGFTLETMGASPGRATSGIHLSFDTAQPLPDGSRTKTQISEEAALKLWDSVVESIRPLGN